MGYGDNTIFGSIGGKGSWIEQYKRAILRFANGKDYGMFTDILNQALKAAVHDIGLQHDFEERSGNLVDSIGGCLFVNGHLAPQCVHFARRQRSFATHKGWDKHGIESDTGRGYLMSYFEELKKKNKGSRGFRLYIVAAAYYGDIIEKGLQVNGGKNNPGGNIGRKYRVITASKNTLTSVLYYACKRYNNISGLGNKGGVRNFVVDTLGTSYEVTKSGR